MKYDHLYPRNAAGFQTFQLASGYISLTGILFEEENITAKIEAHGSTEFFDGEDRLLAAFDLPAQTGGREVYETVSCGRTENALVLRFPIVRWIDNYPNCDGEHDRWDSVVIGCHTLTYDLTTNRILYQDR